MQYKTAERILLEIAEDKQAPLQVRMGAARILVPFLAEGVKLPTLKGYKSGSSENLLLRLASDSRVPSKDRFRAIKQLLALRLKNDQAEKITAPEPVSTVASDADSIWVTGDDVVNLEAGGSA